MSKVKHCLCGIMGICLVAAGACSTKNTNSDFSWFEKGVTEYAASVPVYANQPSNVSAIAPEVLFGYANDLYKKGEKERSVFVYYLARVRGKILLESRKTATSLEIPYYEQAKRQAGVLILGKQIYLDSPTRYGLYKRDIVPALGQEINYWAGGYPDIWAAEIQRALNYENTHPFRPDEVLPAENLLSKNEIKKVSEAAKKEYQTLITWITTNKSQILEKRTQQKAAMENFEKKLAALKQK